MTSDAHSGQAGSAPESAAREYTRFVDPSQADQQADHVPTENGDQAAPVSPVGAGEPANEPPAATQALPHQPDLQLFDVVEETDWSEPTLSQQAEPAPDDPPAAAEAEAEAPEPMPELVFDSVPVAPRTRRPRIEYTEGHVASWHPQLIERAADVAVAAMPIPLRVLDVGCGDGHLLAELILRVPYANLYVGVDPVPGVISATRRASDPRLTLVRGAAESLPFADASFDLVLAIMSFAYWVNQQAGVEELARVVADNGKVVIVESTGRNPKRKDRARSVKEVSELLADAGLSVEHTETVRRSKLFRATARAFVASP
jgi:SAM-dependent methyltransferase